MRYTPIFPSAQLSEVLRCSVRGTLDVSTQLRRHDTLGGSLGYDVAEKLHLEATSRGFSNIHIHKYDWSGRRGHFQSLRWRHLEARLRGSGIDLNR